MSSEGVMVGIVGNGGEVLRVVAIWVTARRKVFNSSMMSSTIPKSMMNPKPPKPISSQRMVTSRLCPPRFTQEGVTAMPTRLNTGWLLTCLTSLSPELHNTIPNAESTRLSFLNWGSIGTTITTIKMPIPMTFSSIVNKNFINAM